MNCETRSIPFAKRNRQKTDAIVSDTVRFFLLIFRLPFGGFAKPHSRLSIQSREFSRLLSGIP